MSIIDREGSTLEDMIKKQPDKKLLEELEKERNKKKGIGTLLKKLFSPGIFKD